jgi:hypothetical protein
MISRSQHSVQAHTHRNADSPVDFGDGTLKFVKPLEENQLFEEFLDHITSQELSHTSGDVRYAQTRQRALLELKNILLTGIRE